MAYPLHGNGFTVGFSDREVTAWGGLALMKQMLDRLQFLEAFPEFGLPEASSNRGYAPCQLIEQFIVSIWCGACRFAHAEMVRLDNVLSRLFGWSCVAEFKAIMRLFGRPRQESFAVVSPAKKTGLVLRPVGKCLRPDIL